MTDADLAHALEQAKGIEAAARAHWQATRIDLAEADQALIVVRLATPLRRSLETWMATRAARAALRHP